MSATMEKTIQQLLTELKEDSKRLTGEIIQITDGIEISDIDLFYSNLFSVIDEIKSSKLELQFYLLVIELLDDFGAFLEKYLDERFKTDFLYKLEEVSKTRIEFDSLKFIGFFESNDESENVKEMIANQLFGGEYDTGYLSEYIRKYTNPNDDDKKVFNKENVRLLLLKELGIIDFLNDNHNLTARKFSELLAEILNSNPESLRPYLSHLGSPKRTKNNPANKTSINTLDTILKKFGLERRIIK